ncbi:hypothetical protein TWF481_005280 [Arthrobotrys musiformis]|uniref:Uncharacterized protein n=1 Tax=Arthrobotrys musiformis TaxID=47236 RepID=A0AAV9WD76_9PEZI
MHGTSTKQPSLWHDDDDEGDDDEGKREGENKRESHEDIVVAFIFGRHRYPSWPVGQKQDGDDFWQGCVYYLDPEIRNGESIWLTVASTVDGDD